MQNTKNKTPGLGERAAAATTAKTFEATGIEEGERRMRRKRQRVRVGTDFVLC